MAHWEGKGLCRGEGSDRAKKGSDPSLFVRRKTARRRKESEKHDHDNDENDELGE